MKVDFKNFTFKSQKPKTAFQVTTFANAHYWGNYEKLKKKTLLRFEINVHQRPLLGFKTLLANF